LVAQTEDGDLSERSENMKKRTSEISKLNRTLGSKKQNAKFKLECCFMLEK